MPSKLLAGSIWRAELGCRRVPAHGRHPAGKLRSRMCARALLRAHRAAVAPLDQLEHVKPAPERTGTAETPTAKPRTDSTNRSGSRDTGFRPISRPVLVAVVGNLRATAAKFGACGAGAPSAFGALRARTVGAAVGHG